MTHQHKGLAEKVRDFVLEGFTPCFAEKSNEFAAHATWARMRQLGSDLWLDTGSIEDAADVWTREFTALTTNNTLLNREVQKGTYDGLIPAAAAALDEFDLSPRGLSLELAFILNARHALRLVEQFNAFVSVEEHTDLAHDMHASVEFARRYYRICPERFIIKIPFTPAGVLAARKLAAEGVPVNQTLGFSARQNYVITRIARPQFVNVFLGRLGAFVADNGLGSGDLVGERATLASQAVVSCLRQQLGVPTRQIGASFRTGSQVRNLAGVDVLTIPPKITGEFLDLGIDPDDLANLTAGVHEPPLAKYVTPRSVGLNTLWEVGTEVVECADSLALEDLDAFGPDDLTAHFADSGCGDLLVHWTADQIAASAREGKIPSLANWKDALAAGEIGLDALMNLAGLNTFAADQKAMDQRVKQTLHVR